MGFVTPQSTTSAAAGMSDEMRIISRRTLMVSQPFALMRFCETAPPTLEQMAIMRKGSAESPADFLRSRPSVTMYVGSQFCRMKNDQLMQLNTCVSAKSWPNW